MAGAKQGLVIRGGDVLERLSGIDYVALDKVRTAYISLMYTGFIYERQIFISFSERTQISFPFLHDYRLGL